MARRKPTIEVLQVRAADSPGYVRLVLSDPVGSTQAGELVTVNLLTTRNGGTCELMLHGQRELDVPGTFTSVTFPDGSVYTPPA